MKKQQISNTTNLYKFVASGETDDEKPFRLLPTDYILSIDGAYSTVEEEFICFCLFVSTGFSPLLSDLHFISFTDIMQCTLNSF